MYGVNTDVVHKLFSGINFSSNSGSSGRISDRDLKAKNVRGCCSQREPWRYSMEMIVVGRGADEGV